LKLRVLKSAVSGLLVWLTYGVVEFALAYGSHRHLLFLKWQWKLLGLLFGAYAVMGFVLGGAIGVLLLAAKRAGGADDSGTQNQTAAALTLVLAFLINLLLGWPLPREEYVAFGLALALTALFAAAVTSRAWLQRTSFLANPWFLAPLLLASPWFGFEIWNKHSEPARTLVPLLLTGAIMAAAAGWHRWFGKRAARASQQWRTLGVTAAIGCAAIAVLQWNAPLSVTQASGPAMPGRCNVVLITMDTVRADHLPLYGYDRDTTPHLREFARQATLYRRATAAADMTLPAHASIFTGLYPGWHGAHLGVPGYPIGRPLPSQAVTLAGLLRNNGYQTAAVVGNWAYLAPSMGLDQGFTEYDSHRPVRLADSERPFYLSLTARSLLGHVVGTNEFAARVLRAADINERGLTWLSQAGHDKPFFLFLNYMDAHAPYIPPAPFDTAFPGKDPHFTPWVDYENVRRAVLSGSHLLTDPEKRHIVSQYDGTIAYMDSELGKLLDNLRARGVYENTLIIITSDHGEAFGEHNLMEHATGFLYEDQVHVPLFVKYPGQHEVQAFDAPVSEVDLMPTILDVAGISSSGLQGRSLRSPRTDDSGPVYAEDQAFGYLGKYPRFRGVRRAIFAGHLKLLTWTAGPPQFYDLSTDPGEAHDLYRPDDPRATALLARLNAWTASIPGRPSKSPRTPPDKSDVDRLKSLGYIQ